MERRKKTMIKFQKYKPYNHCKDCQYYDSGINGCARPDGVWHEGKTIIRQCLGIVRESLVDEAYWAYIDNEIEELRKEK